MSANLFCLNCESMHQAERDEDGLSFPTARCQFPGCEIRLCESCPQFRCECGRTMCLDHSAVIEDGTREGLRLCEACRATDESYVVIPQLAPLTCKVASLDGILEFEPECECVQIDVDQDDARDCPLHGPHGPLARAALAREADEIWAYYNYNAPAIAVASEEAPF